MNEPESGHWITNDDQSRWLLSWNLILLANAKFAGAPNISQPLTECQLSVIFHFPHSQSFAYFLQCIVVPRLAHSTDKIYRITRFLQWQYWKDHFIDLEPNINCNCNMNPALYVDLVLKSGMTKYQKMKLSMWWDQFVSVLQKSILKMLIASLEIKECCSLQKLVSSGDRLSCAGMPFKEAADHFRTASQEFCNAIL